MKIKIVLYEDSELSGFDMHRFLAQSDFPNVSMYSYDAERAVHNCKGAVLCAIGQWSTVPDTVRFVVTRRVAQHGKVGAAVIP